MTHCKTLISCAAVLWIPCACGSAPPTAASAAANAAAAMPFVLQGALDLPEGNRFLEALRAAPTTAGLTIVTFDEEALGSERLIIPARGESHLYALSSLERSDASFEWTGRAMENSGTAVFTVRDGACTGFFRTEDGLFLVRPIGGGLHALVLQDESRMPPDHPPEASSPPEGPPPGERHDEAALEETVSGPFEVTVLVAYTPAVTNAVLSVPGLIDSAVAAANLSYRQSQIPLTLRVVGTIQVEYTETTHERDVERLRTRGDGFLEDLHPRRDAVRADVVVLLVDAPAYCGYAAAILADESSAFATVHHSCADANLSFAHELGHLFGARHNPEADPTATPYPWGHGMTKADQHWRTVMGYPCPAGCRRLAYWSSPSLTHEGMEMGTSALHHNARVLAARSKDVAAFR